MTAKTTSQVRTMKKDIARLEGRDIPKSEPSTKEVEKNEPGQESGVFDNIENEDIEKIKKYKHVTREEKRQLEKKVEVINEELEKINKNLREIEKKEGDIKDRAFRKKKREILKKRRIAEEEKIKAKKKINKRREHLEKFKYFENKISNYPS